MSLAARNAIAEKANVVLGAKRITPYYRQSTTAGWGWVSLGVRNRDASGFGFLNTWEVRVVLSQEIAKAEKWIDDHADALAAALEEVMVVTSLAPAVLNLDSKTTVNALIVEGVREH